jgi:hydrogenase large subunit
MGFLCVGTLGEGQSQAQPLISAGIWTGDHFDTYTTTATESVARSFYELPAERRKGGPLLQPAPSKATAYSWIKAPRQQGKPMEVGPLARLALLHHSIAAGDTADLLDDLAKLTGSALTGASSVSARTLARLAEARILTRRCGELLDQLAPGQPTLAESVNRRITGDGMAELEAPAGSLRHRASFTGGSITLWDMVGPSTWNGSPQDEAGQSGPIEVALNSSGLDLNRKEDRLAASRIVHSFAFSTVDAIH